MKYLTTLLKDISVVKVVPCIIIGRSLRSKLDHRRVHSGADRTNLVGRSRSWTVAARSMSSWWSHFEARGAQGPDRRRHGGLPCR